MIGDKYQKTWRHGIAILDRNGDQHKVIHGFIDVTRTRGEGNSSHEDACFSDNFLLLD